MKKYGVIAFLLSLSCIAFAQQSFYVSPNGSKSGDGSVKAPWGSFQQAVNGVRAYRETHPDKKIEILFADGVYHVVHSIKLGEKDSGSPKAPIIYKAMEGAHPVFTGGVLLKDWRKVTDKKVLSKLPKSVAGKLYACKLPKSFDLQTVPMKAGERVPLNEQWERNEGARTDLVCDDQFQTLARYPNKGFMNVGDILSQPSEEDPDNDVRFSFHDKRIARWKSESDIYLGGYWKWDWCDEYQHVTGINIADSTFVLSKPYHKRGYKQNAHYFGVNLLCELDSVSEYYVDRKARRVYWYPRVGVDLKNAQIGLTNLTAPYMIEFDGCSNVCLEGLTFRDGSRVCMRINEGEHVHIDECRILCFSESALDVMGRDESWFGGCTIG